MFQQSLLFSTSYGSIHVACEIDLEQNCHQQMRVLGIQKQTMDGLIVDIFGEEDVATRIHCGGIVDSRDHYVPSTCPLALDPHQNSQNGRKHRE